MNIAVLGTGQVGQTIGSKLIECGHTVVMGSRSAENETGLQWAKDNGATLATFDDAARGSELLFNCTNGIASIEALSSIDHEHRVGKVLIDLANEISFTDAGPVSLASAQRSLGAHIQKEFPQLDVVKTLCTVTAGIMVNPSLLKGETSVFVSGDSGKAKDATRKILNQFGWSDASIVDLGGIETAHAQEMYLALWLEIYKSKSDPMFNIAIEA